MSKERTKDLDELRSKTRSLPSSPETEKDILGALLIDRKAVDRAAELLTPDSFFVQAHKIIFGAILDIFQSGDNPDITTVYEKLRSRDKIDAAGGAKYLTELSQRVASSANIDTHIKILLEKYVLRNLIETSNSISEKAYGEIDDPYELLQEAESSFFTLIDKYFKSNYLRLDKGVKEALEYIEALHAKGAELNCVPTDYIELDQLLGNGFQKSDLIIIAARPSMGKTAFALSIARNAALQHNMPTAFFSLEMGATQLIIRLICAEAGLDMQKVRAGKVPAKEQAQLAQNIHKLSKAPIYIDDSPYQSILEIRSKTKRLRNDLREMDSDLGMIVIDYLQLMSPPPRMESREREISYISRSLKALAKELKIPVVALAQLNRASEQRTDKKPFLSDLRESGAIEQDADVVMLLHRPEYYGKTADNQTGESLEGIAEVIVAKQRNGPTGEVKLRFIKEFARFENYAVFGKQYEEMGAPPQIKEDAPF